MFHKTLGLSRFNLTLATVSVFCFRPVEVDKIVIRPENTNDPRNSELYKQNLVEKLFGRI